MKLDHVEQCAREEFGGSTRVALLLTLTQVVRGLMVEVDHLRADRTLAEAEALRTSLDG